MDAVKHMLEATHLRNEPQVDPEQPPVSYYTVFFFTANQLLSSSRVIPGGHISGQLYL